MAKVWIFSQESGILVFRIWKSLNYRIRLGLSLLFFLTGLFFQYLNLSVWPGLIFLLCGILLVLPKGLDNRVNLGKFEIASEWEKVGGEKLNQFLDFEKKVKKWDRSLIDITCPRGFLIFFLLIVFLSTLGIQALDHSSNPVLRITFWDALVLIVPFWFTGLRTVFLVPEMTKKIRFVQAVISQCQQVIPKLEVDYFFLLQGKTKVPKDIKFKVRFPNAPPDFLGLYGQVVLNNVQGVPYPYFYAVLVAQKSFELPEKTHSVKLGRPYLVEQKTENEVNVLVIRQDTKVGARGYYTPEKAATQLFQQAYTITTETVKIPTAS